MIHKILIILILSYQVPLQGVQLFPVSLQIISEARQMRRALSLHQWETSVKANSVEASNESNLDTPNLKRNESVKRNDARDKEGGKKG